MSCRDDRSDGLINKDPIVLDDWLETGRCRDKEVEVNTECCTFMNHCDCNTALLVGRGMVKVKDAGFNFTPIQFDELGGHTSREIINQLDA